LSQLDLTLTYLHKSRIEFVICGDFNVNFLTDSNLKLQLSLLLQSYKMFHTIDFPTTTTNSSSSAMDIMFIDYFRVNSFEVFPLFNGLSDHNAQCLILNNIFSASHKGSKPYVREKNDS
jgi:endonuclease/exonuclease/phosphatase family metal-dependent hydrolase